jgi:hypothetical protein
VKRKMNISMKKVIRLTESDLTRIVKRVINEREFSPSLSEFAQQEIKPYLEEKGYRVGLFGNVSDIPMDRMKDNDKLAALVIDGLGRQLTVVLSNSDEASSLLGMSDGEEGELINDLGISDWRNAQEGDPAIMDRRYYGDGLALVLTTKF